MNFQYKKGFTLIELLAVIVVLGIVSVIATTLVVRYMSNARIDAFAVEASNVIAGAKNAVSMNELNKLEIENNDNSCKIGNRMCFTIDTLIELGIFKGNKEVYDGKVNIDISDKQNLKYKLYLEKKNEFNIIDSNVIDYSKNKDIINKGNFSGDEVEQYTICSCIEDKTKPTITGSALDNNTTSPKIKFTSNETGTYCVNTSSLESNIENCVFEGIINANEEVVTDSISTSHTYYVHVKDEASNVGVSTSIDIVKTICNPNTTFSSCLLNAKTTGFNSTMEGGLYRYQGTSVDNYICFGTNNDCLNYPNRYYYQIIGVNSNGQVKIIKSKTLNIDYMFYSNEWPSSALYSKLNGDSFLTNANYISSGWENKIATTNWKYGDTTSINYTAYNMYSIENKFSKSVSAKIGLMYLHDYYYAYQSGGLNCSQNGSYSLCKNSWIHKSNCAPNVDTGFIDEASFEFTMIRHGGADSLNGVSIWKIGEDGVVETNTSSVVSENRPVFYLKSTVNYVSGTGKSDDPFIIS